MPSAGRCFLAGLCMLALGLAAACNSSSAASPLRPSGGLVSSSPGAIWHMVDLPGQPANESRTAVFDPTRNAIWVLSAVPGPTDMLVLTRIDAADRTVVSSVVLPNDGYWPPGTLAVGPDGTIWTGSGPFLRSYVPETGVITSYHVPAYSGLARLYAGDDTVFSIAIDAAGELWVARTQISGIFGFNSASDRWDRTINLPFAPGGGGSLTVAGPDLLALGADALVNTMSGAVQTLPITGGRDAVTGSGQLVFQDASGNLISLDLGSGRSTVLALNSWPVGMGDSASVVISPTGDVWVPAGAGVVRYRPQDRQTSLLLFPHPSKSPKSVADFPRPMPICGPAGQCLLPTPCASKCPAPLVYPGIDSMVVDGQGDLWVITEEPSLGGPFNANAAPSMAPVAELMAPA